MIQQLLRNIAEKLDSNKIPYMIIGGQAVLVYGTPRLTRDIDITLGVDIDMFSKIENICKSINLTIFPKDAEKFVHTTHVLPVADMISNIRVDFIFSFTPYEKQAILRSNNIESAGYPVKFAAIEDLIIHKMFAGRAIDEEDIKNVLIKNIKNVDLSYINKWLKDFSSLPDKSTIIERFQNIVNSI